MVRHLAGLCLALGILACGRATGDAGNSAHSAAQQAAALPRPASQSPSAAVDSAVLTLASLPASAQAALRDSAPNFVPLDPSTYPPIFVAIAHQSADEGLVLIRADIQGQGRVDYAVAGMDNDSLRVVALFQQPDGGYRVVHAFAYSKRGSPFARNRPPGVPALALERAPCEFRCKKSTFAIVPRFFGDDTGSPPPHLIWLPDLRQFASDEPID